MGQIITYNFELENGNTWNYKLEFDSSHRLVAQEAEQARDWTKLEFHKCPHCPLNKEKHPLCPVARNLDRVVEDSKTTLSIMRAVVTVKTAERTYSKSCDTQEGLRSLFGLIMASSGCPHLDWLRPLARFHLPFSDTQESLFRVLSLQLLDKFFTNEKASLCESSKELQERYHEVEKVNHAFVNRIRNYCKADADKNALAALDVLVQLFPYHMQANFESLRPYFKND